MRKQFLIIFLIIASLITLPFRNYAGDEPVKEINLYLGQAKALVVNNPTRIVIANPNIADVIRATKSEITLNPKAAGVTSFTVWDSQGEHSLRLRVLTEDLADAKNRIDRLLKELNLPRVSTRLIETEEKILLMGEVKTAGDRERIFLALGNLKDKVVDLIKIREEEAVVDIDVQVLELSKDATNTLGLTNPLMTTSGYSITEVGSPGIASAGVKWSTLFKVLNLKRDTAFSWTLYALIQEGKARVLSRPRLVCQSGKEAELVVGGEKPIFTTTYVPTAGGTTGASTGVDYKPYGIILKIKPTVTEEEKIKLALNVEVSEVGTADTIGGTNTTAKAYPLTKRSASTEVYLIDGETLSIGGLIKQKKEEDVSKTPFFGDIPILGFFFKKKVTTTGGGATARGDMELYITLTPRIISEKREEMATAKTTPVLSETPSPEEKLTDAKTEYGRTIQKYILENLAYPASAKEAGLQGTVKLSLHLSSSGELLEAIVKTSSGANLLDGHAISVVKGIASYPAFPSSLDAKEIWVDVPIVYRLD